MKIKRFIYFSLFGLIFGCNHLEENKDLSVSKINSDSIKTETLEIKSLNSYKVVSTIFGNKINTSIDTGLIFNTWVIDPKGPNADFDITAKSFFKVDYDGNGDCKYSIINNTIIVFGEEGIEEGEILKLTKDSLSINWKSIEMNIDYVVWKN